ncbi:polyphosphate--glucose phosphotransferase [Georgenia sp. Z1344]|uniref:polyphosphate--glucose phosphotransferase n=1 Tax=Georgenia sp. Z1344 TaxID=3416706 RepID=UPI003CF2C050
MATNQLAFGIDIGGSGIKGAPVDLSTGQLTTDRVKIPTPQPSTPAAVIEVLGRLLAEFEEDDDVPVGLTFPAPVLHGGFPFVANLDQSWVGMNIEDEVRRELGREIVAMNDADAAGVAEAHYGAAKGVDGVVLLTTLGTGIGSALLVDGILVPNTELGHLEIDGRDAESHASSAVREREGLSYPKWAKRLQRYYEVVEKLFSPDLIVVGGGVSRKHEKFLPLIETRAPMVPAELRNNAGIVGAAYRAVELAR